ncbi:MAG TPA: alpha/beta hydrolase [Thermoanaerobaculia bacterium]|nr:alpha/beta hydrolase [Thermoanaerobaculia bacterium]
MTTAEHREVALRDGRRLAYLEIGSGEGKPIVHCHGAPSSRVEGALVFDPAVATELGVRVVVPDRPGMGRSDFQRHRRIVDWPSDVKELADALRLDDFAVLGSSGGSPYALACGAALRGRVRRVGVLGGIAPLDAPGMMAAVHGPLRAMVRLARGAPPIARGLFRLNLRAMRGGGGANDRMARMFPEPDRTLLQRADIREEFMACFEEACRRGARGAVWDLGLLGRPWGFDLAALDLPVELWHGERDRNVPVAHGRFLAGVIPGCRATYYPDDAHLSTFVNHRRELLAALAA